MRHQPTSMTIHHAGAVPWARIRNVRRPDPLIYLCAKRRKRYRSAVSSRHSQATCWRKRRTISSARAAGASRRQRIGLVEKPTSRAIASTGISKSAVDREFSKMYDVASRSTSPRCAVSPKGYSIRFWPLCKAVYRLHRSAVAE